MKPHLKKTPIFNAFICYIIRIFFSSGAGTVKPRAGGDGGQTEEEGPGAPHS